MRRLRYVLFLAFSSLGCVALWVTRSEAKPETVRIVAPGVWFREGDLEGAGHCNNIIIEMKDYLIVVDAKAWPTK